MASLLDADPRLAAELAEIRLLAGAACAAIFGSTTEKQEAFRQAARDNDWFHRYMKEPHLDVIVGNATAEKLRRYKRRGSHPPSGGLLNLEEVAHAGRDVVAAIPGIGKVSMAKLDKAIGEEDGLEWADAKREAVAA
jgi:hypothetical protein